MKSVRVLVVSDLHLEFQPDGGEALISRLADAEVVVVAGDLSVTETLYPALDRLRAKYPHVVFVNGNHELYNSVPHLLDQLLDAYAAAHPEFHRLSRSTATVGGVRFVGCTLWFGRFPGYKQQRRKLNDFELIDDFEPWVFEENARDRDFLERTVVPGDFVVTHHIPAPGGLDPRYRGDPLNGFFLSDMEAVIRKNRPAIWAFGHTHSSADFRIGATRLVCNPFGYFGYGDNPRFDPGLVVEMPAAGR